MRIIQGLGGALGLWLCVACGETDNDEPKASGAASSGGSSAGFGGKSGGSSQSEGGSVVKDPPLDHYAESYARATCEVFSRCFGALVLDIPGCTESLKLAINEQAVPEIDEAIAAGRIDYHADKLAACVEQISTASCDEAAFEKCNDVFVGKTKLGEACTVDLECEGLGQCQVDGACPGTCAAAAKLGEPCSRFNSCQRGLKCSDSTQMCVATAKLGEACVYLGDCSGYALCHEGTCISRGSLDTSAEGGPCESLTGPGCQAGLVCTTALEGDEVVGRCQPKVASGAACTYSTPDACPDGEYCRITSETGVKPATGTCQKSPKLGEECRWGTFYSTSCDEEQYCDTDTTLCTSINHLDEACASDAGCFSDTCAGGKCVPRIECEVSERSATSM
jgi:hypothetical protein